MKRIVTSILGSALAIVLVAAAMGQTTQPAGGANTAPTTPSASNKAPESAQPEATPAPESTPAKEAPVIQETPPSKEAPAAKSNPKLERVRERGNKASPNVRADVDKKLDEIEKQIENEATAKGDAAVAARIAGEFGVTADALTAERSQFSRGWGEILVAHTLLANTKSDFTVADIFQMRNRGMGWGMIAAGLDLNLNDVVPAIKSEGRVATGLEKGNGKPAMIHAAGKASVGEGAKAGAAAKASAKTAHTNAGVSAAGAGVGAGVDLNKGTGK